MEYKSISQAELAKILEVTARTIRNWILENQDGDYPFPIAVKSVSKTTGDKYNLSHVVSWLMADAARKAVAKLDASDVNKDAASLRKTLAEAELKEMELARRKGELLEVQDIERTWTGALARFRSTLLGCRGSLAEDVLRLEHPTFPLVAEIYDGYVYQALTELSELKDSEAQSEVEDIEIEIEKK
jgi:phage terminase Nu1 subunit (DNA packaging protein)